MKKFLCALFIMISTSAYAETKPNEPICEKAEQVQKILNDKGFFLLLNMETKDGVLESLWIGGQSAVIVAKAPKDEKSCVVALLDNVIYNSDTITGLAKAYEAQSKKQKDI
jgi:hypothetical protein